VAFVSFGDDPVFTYPLPDEKDTVLKIRLRQE
jgi:alpha-L-fucosidase